MNPPNPVDEDGPGVREPDPGADGDAAPSEGNLHLQAIRSQVEQARAILADAISKLSTSFTTVDAEARVQRHVMETLLTSLAGGNSPAGSGASAPPGRPREIPSIREFTIETATFLTTFTDLLGSVSEQSIRTTYRLDDMVERLDEVFALVNGIGGIASDTLALAAGASLEAARTEGGRAAAPHLDLLGTSLHALGQRTRALNAEIETQVEKARANVSEVRDIIAAMATRDLDVALSGKARIESMLSELDQFQRFVADSVTRASSATTKVSEATSQAVTALQFEDILTQLVASIRDRAEHLAGASSELLGRASAIPRSKFSEPVQQRDMTPGKVELF